MPVKNRNTKKFYWNCSIIDFLIAHYKENPCLYDGSHEDYNNQVAKSHALNSILEKIQKFYPTVELSDVEEKIQTMHVEVSEEMFRIEAAKAAGNNYETQLYCFEQLKFLHKHITPLEPKEDEIKEENPLDEEDDYEPDGDCDGLQDTKVQMPTRAYRRKFRWRREDLKKFIKSLYKYNILYDSSHKNYLNRQFRCIAYKKLLKETKRIDPIITLNDIRDKMRCLRKQYMKEVRLVKRAMENDVIYKPVLWCFGLLLNLYYDEFGIKSYNKLIIDDTSDDNSFDSIPASEDTLNNDESTTNNELYEFEEIHQLDDDVVEFDDEQDNKDATQNNEHIKKSTNNSSDEVNYEWLGELVLSQMEEITQNYRTDFAWDVQCLIRKYILKSNAEAEESPVVASSSSSSGSNNRKRKRSISSDNVQESPSNVSFNISFL